MNWDDVRYFLELARSGSLSSASRSSGVEHTTVARRVAALEDALAVRLFDRLPRGWRLTEAGKGLLPMAEALELDAIGFERRALGAAALTGSVRVSAPPVLATHFVLPHLAQLAKRHPEICVELSADRRGANLLRGEAEIALRVGPVDVPPGLIVRQLGHVGYGLYGTKELVQREPEQQAFAAFDDSMRGSAQKDWLDRYAGKRAITFRSNDLMSLFVAAQRGLGITLLPHFMVDQSAELQLLPSAGPPFQRPLSLLLHPDLRRSRRVSAVVDFLLRLARKQSEVLLAPAL
jgi:DNA-binding transcriptional LysR family regulator